MVSYGRHDVDRLFRAIPDAATVWLTQPSYDSQPRERRPVDQLPGGVTDYLTLTEALERLTHTRRVVFKCVVMGLVRVPHRGQWVEVRVRPMTYRECADYLDLSESAVSMNLMRARDALARILSDEEEGAAA